MFVFQTTGGQIYKDEIPTKQIGGFKSKEKNIGEQVTKGTEIVYGKSVKLETNLDVQNLLNDKKIDVKKSGIDIKPLQSLISGKNLDEKMDDETRNAAYSLAAALISVKLSNEPDLLKIYKNSCSSNQEFLNGIAFFYRQYFLQTNGIASEINRGINFERTPISEVNKQIDENLRQYDVKNDTDYASRMYSGLQEMFSLLANILGMEVSDAATGAGGIRDQNLATAFMAAPLNLTETQKKRQKKIVSDMAGKKEN